MRLKPKSQLDIAQLKIGDVILVASLLFIMILLFINMYAKNSSDKMVEVISQDSTEFYSLDKNRTINVTGPLGETTVVIRDGKTWIEDSPCPHKLCVLMGKIHRTGQQVICVPNKVVVEVIGLHEEIDAVSR